MALYHFSTEMVRRASRSDAPTARSSVRASAYQSRELLPDEHAGRSWDFRDREADLQWKAIVLPEHAPIRWEDRATLWNDVEWRERRYDAQPARVFILTAPRELDIEQNIELARTMAGAMVLRGMVADVAVHQVIGSDGLPQPHIHIQTTTRQIEHTRDGVQFGPKEPAWNTYDQLLRWREQWADIVNRGLERAGQTARVYHRRFQSQIVQPVREQAERSRRFMVRTRETVLHIARDLAHDRWLREVLPAGVEKIREVAIGRQRKPRRPIPEPSRAEPTPPARAPRVPRLKQEIARVSPEQAVAEFETRLRAMGFRLDGPARMDGRRHRVAVEGDRGHEKSGGYWGYLDSKPAGFAQNFKTGEKWRGALVQPGTRIDYDPAKLAADREARRAVTEAAQSAAAAKARDAWDAAKPARSHPYLDRKGVRSEGLRVSGRGELLVPLTDIQGKLWNVQRISPDPSRPKLFLKNGRAQGMHARIGKPQPDAPLVIAEGWATARSVHEATGLPVVAAMYADNLAHVARAYRERHPDRVIVIASDNDASKPTNKGLVKAQEAARAVGGRVIAPEFGEGEKGTDWNDYAQKHGLTAVRAAFEKEDIPMSDRDAERLVRELEQREASRTGPRVAGAPLTEAEKREVAADEARWREIEKTPGFRDMQFRAEERIASLRTGEVGRLDTRGATDVWVSREAHGRDDQAQRRAHEAQRSRAQERSR